MERYLILGATFALAAAAQPGPLQSYLISQALQKGWRRTAPAAFAPLVSDGPILAVVLVVLTQVPAWMERGLRIAGGLFLLYLAWGTWRAWRRFDPAALTDRATGGGTLGRAVLVNLLNPNPYLGWSLVLGPLLLEGWRESPGHGIALLAGFYATLVAGLLTTIVLFATTRRMGPKVSRVLLGLSAVALAAFGGYQLVRGVLR